MPVITLQYYSSYVLVTNVCLMPEVVINWNITQYKSSLFQTYIFEMRITDFFSNFFRVMEKDPFHANCLPVHIGTLVELNKANGKKHNI